MFVVGKEDNMFLIGAKNGFRLLIVRPVSEWPPTRLGVVSGRGDFLWMIRVVAVSIV